MKLALRARAILESRVWFQTKLLFIYLNYISNQSILYRDFFVFV